MILINNREKSLYMKRIIKKVLDRHSSSQGNMASDSFRDMLAVEIACNIAEDSKNHGLRIEMWKGYQPENKDQMKLKLDVETKHFADDFHEGKI